MEGNEMSRVNDLENRIVENKGFIVSKEQQIETLLSDIETLKGKIEADEAELAQIRERRDIELKAALVSVFKDFEDVEGLHDKVVMIVSDHFDLDEEGGVTPPTHGGVIVPEGAPSVEDDSAIQQEQEQHSRDVDEFEMTFGIKYPTSEINGEKARHVVAMVAQTHKENPGDAAPKLELLISKYAHLFDLEGLTVIKEARLALDEFLSLGKSKVKSDVISPDDNLDSIPF